MGGKGKRAILVGGGPLHELLLRAALAAGNDLLVAVDGGGQPLVDLGYEPQVLLGDFDSLPSAYKEALMAKGVKVLSYPPEKDWTDLEIGLDQLFAAGYKELLVFGALGGRLDHTLANLALLAKGRAQGCELVLIGAEQAVTLLTAKERLRIFPFPGGHFSLLPFVGTAYGVTIRNAKYLLNQATLALGSTRGVHNEFLRGPAEVSLASGSVLVIVEGLKGWQGQISVFQLLPSSE